MRLVWDEPAEVTQWVGERLPYRMGAADFGPCQAVGVLSTAGAPLGGVVFHNYRGRTRDIELTFASATPRWLTRRIITGIMAYPFHQLACQRVTSVTPKRNRPSRIFQEVFGFKREGLVRRGYLDDDAVIAGLLAEEWAASPFNLDRPEGVTTWRPYSQMRLRAGGKPAPVSASLTGISPAVH